MFNQIHEYHFADGVVSSHYQLLEGSKFPHGHAFWNFPSGQRRLDGYYTNGIRSGCWTEFESVMARFGQLLIFARANM